MESRVPQTECMGFANRENTYQYAIFLAQWNRAIEDGSLLFTLGG